MSTALLARLDALLERLDQVTSAAGERQPVVVRQHPPRPPSPTVLRLDAVNRWLADHPPPPCPPDRCAHCGEVIDARATGCVPVLRSEEAGDHLWLHVGCYPTWHERRVAEAKAATE